MIGLIFGDTDFPKEILKTVKKRKIKYLRLDKSIIRYFIFLFLIVLSIFFGKSVSPKINPIIL